MGEKFTLEDIFHSSGNTIRCIQYGDIGKLIQDNIISIRAELLGDGYFVSWIHRLDIEGKSFGDDSHRTVNECVRAMGLPYLMFSGGNHHAVLGHYAVAFLRDKGYEVEHETWRNGKRVDVATSSDDWIIECGDTNADVVHEHLYFGCKSYAVMPFNYGNHMPIIFIFEKGMNWDDGYSKYSNKLIEQRIPKTTGIDWKSIVETVQKDAKLRKEQNLI